MPRLPIVVPPTVLAPEPEPIIDSLTIPDDLLAWGRVPERAMTFPRDWSRDIDSLLARSGGEPLGARDTETLLSRVEGLVGAAVNAGRTDLVAGIDTQTARQLCLQVTVSTPRGPMRIGVDDHDAWSWEELAVVKHAHDTALEARAEDSAAPDPSKLADAVWAAKALLLEVFPAARITEVSDTSTPRCSSCTLPVGSCSLALESGGTYCTKCWRDRFSPPKPAPEPTPPKKKRR